MWLLDEIEFDNQTKNVMVMNVGILYTTCSLNMVVNNLKYCKSMHSRRDNDNDNDKVFYSTLIIHFILHITAINVFAY